MEIFRLGKNFLCPCLKIHLVECKGLCLVLLNTVNQQLTDGNSHMILTSNRNEEESRAHTSRATIKSLFPMLYSSNHHAQPLEVVTACLRISILKCSLLNAFKSILFFSTKNTEKLIFKLKRKKRKCHMRSRIITAEDLQERRGHTPAMCRSGQTSPPPHSTCHSPSPP